MTRGTTQIRKAAFHHLFIVPWRRVEINAPSQGRQPQPASRKNATNGD
jgi:hypothetical protein